MRGEKFIKQNGNLPGVSPFEGNFMGKARTAMKIIGVFN
jgi:hypothetical protein